MGRGLKRVGWAVVNAILWCLSALAALGWSLVMVVLAAILVLAWVGVLFTGGRDWMAILLAAAITASFVPVMRREWSKQREVRASLQKSAPPTQQSSTAP